MSIHPADIQTVVVAGIKDSFSIGFCTVAVPAAGKIPVSCFKIHNISYQQFFRRPFDTAGLKRQSSGGVWHHPDVDAVRELGGVPVHLVTVGWTGCQLFFVSEHPVGPTDTVSGSVRYLVGRKIILIFGGINVEDKECGKDCAGRVYQDYMLKLQGKEHVRTFLEKLENNCDTADGYIFRMNNKMITPAVFEMYDSFLSIINGAQKELVIVMAYFAPIPSIIRAIVSAWERGVRIRILIPERANFQNDSNRKTMRILMQRCSNEIEVRLSPKMVHTKLIYNENALMFGSCNITNRAFKQLGEVDIELKNEDTPLVRSFKESVEENFSLSQPVNDYHQIRHSPVVAWFENRLN